MTFSRSRTVRKSRAGVTAVAASFLVATSILVAACSSESAASSGASLAQALPTEVRCEDAAEFEERAAAERARAAELASDQERILAGQAANFLAAMEVVAHLQCRVAIPEDGALRSALETAQSAAATGGFYEASRLWNDALFQAALAVSELVDRLPPAPVE